MKTIPPKAGNHCFGCGADNPLGLKLAFKGDTDQDRVWVELEALPFMAGAIGMMHGGFIALLLDEASSKVLSLQGKQGVTRNIEVAYEKPVPLGHPIRIQANLINQEGRKHFVEAQILNSNGDVLAKSNALFLTFASK